MKSISRKKLIGDGVAVGLISGAIFAVVEMIYAGSAAGPWRAFASIVGGQEALTGSFTAGTLILGVVVHFVLSAIYGAVFGWFIHDRPEGVARNLLALSGLGIAFGLGIWVLNFPILARLFFPWFLGMNQSAQILIHTLAFGLPLGVGIWVLERTVHRLPRLEKAA